MSASAKTIERETGKDLATHQSGAVSPYVAMMEKAIDKGLDADQLGKFMDLQERWEANEARKAYSAAMARFQAECPPIPKTGRATVSTKSGGQYQYTFPPLEMIQSTIKPHLDNNGLSYQFTDTKVESGELSLACVVMHEAGHSERFPFQIPVDESLHINKAQKVGVANSYAKRYALCNALSLVGFDPDTDAVSPGDSEYITREEAAALRDRLDAVEADVPAFCRYIEVESIEAIPTSKYHRALQAVKKKEAASKDDNE